MTSFQKTDVNNIFQQHLRYHHQDSRMFFLMTMKDDKNFHTVKLILCQCDKIIKFELYYV